MKRGGEGGRNTFAPSPKFWIPRSTSPTPPSEFIAGAYTRFKYNEITWKVISWEMFDLNLLFLLDLKEPAFVYLICRITMLQIIKGFDTLKHFYIR